MGFVSVSSSISRSRRDEKLDDVEKVWMVGIRAAATSTRLLNTERDASFAIECIIINKTVR